MPNYRSGFERSLAVQLNKSKVKWSYEPDKISYVIEKTYTPDFKLERSGVYLEGKGVLDAETRQKMLAVKKQNPDLDIRFVFMSPENRISRTSRTTYSQWAERHGFKWCGPNIPEDWLQ